MTFRLAILLVAAAFLHAAPAPPLKGKVTGGFQAPSTTDPQGRRSVVKGTDATPQGPNTYLITNPQVTSYNPDDTPEMFINAPRCLLDMRSNLASSDASLSMRTADGRFALEGLGWQWDSRSSFLTISNEVRALVAKAVITGGLTNTAGTNQPVKITSQRFQQDGDQASFIGNVLVEDGTDTLRCAQLNLHFARPGGVQQIEAVKDVELTQGETRVLGGLAIYNLQAETLAISEKPRWFAANREGSAERLHLSRSNQVLTAEENVFMRLPVTNVVSSSGTDQQQQTNRFVEIHSDKFQYTGATSNRTAEAIYRENVRVVHGDASLKAAELIAGFDPQQSLNRLNARGEVEITSKGGRAFGDRADYNLAEEKFSLQGNPRWEMDDKSGSSTIVVLFPKTEELLALGNVEMTLPAATSGQSLLVGIPQADRQPLSTNGPMRITAGTFSHQGEVSVFNENVVVRDDRGTIACDLLTVVSGASNQVQRIVAEGAVRIVGQDITATGRHANYDMRTGLVHLTGDPELTGPDKSLRAGAFIIDRNANRFSVAPGSYRIQLQLKDKPSISDRFK